MLLVFVVLFKLYTSSRFILYILIYFYIIYTYYILPLDHK